MDAGRYSAASATVVQKGTFERDGETDGGPIPARGGRRTEVLRFDPSPRPTTRADFARMFYISDT